MKIIVCILSLFATVTSWAQIEITKTVDLSSQFNRKNFFPKENYLCGMNIEFQGDIIIAREIINERAVIPTTASCEQWAACNFNPSFFKKIATNVYINVDTIIGTPVKNPNKIILSPLGTIFLIHDVNSPYASEHPSHENLRGSDQAWICPTP